MAKTYKKLLKDTYYLSEIRRIVRGYDDAYKIVFDINGIIKRWEEQD